MIEGIKNGDVIELNFIVRERTDRYFIHDKTYSIQYRGSTVVDISPRNTDPKFVPMYQRGAMTEPRLRCIRSSASWPRIFCLCSKTLQERKTNRDGEKVLENCTFRDLMHVMRTG